MVVILIVVVVVVLVAIVVVVVVVVVAVVVHCVSKNDTNVAHYNFDADQPILVILCR